MPGHADMQNRAEDIQRRGNERRHHYDDAPDIFVTGRFHI